MEEVQIVGTEWMTPNEEVNDRAQSKYYKSNDCIELAMKDGHVVNRCM